MYAYVYMYGCLYLYMYVCMYKPVMHAHVF